MQNYLVIMALVTGKFFHYTVNRHQCNLFTLCSFFNSLFTVTVTGNNNTYHLYISFITEIFIPYYQSFLFNEFNKHNSDYLGKPVLTSVCISTACSIQSATLTCFIFTASHSHCGEFLSLDDNVLPRKIIPSCKQMLLQWENVKCHSKIYTT